MRVVFRPQALEEIESSRDWYDRQRSGLFYRVLEDEILVLGVVAGRRHPRVWRSRR